MFYDFPGGDHLWEGFDEIRLPRKESKFRPGCDGDRAVYAVGAVVRPYGVLQLGLRKRSNHGPWAGVMRDGNASTGSKKKSLLVSKIVVAICR